MTNTTLNTPTDLSKSHVSALVTAHLQAPRAASALARVAIDPRILRSDDDRVTRAQFALALNIILLDDLLDRVPTGAAYVAEKLASGAPLVFDHGALRTIRMPVGPTGALPAGELAFRRIFEPLGYEDVATYPLPALKMTGRAYCHRDFPESIPQFFLSELHVDQFAPEMQAAAARVFGMSTDPLDEAAHEALDEFARHGAVSATLAQAALPALLAAFLCQHTPPTVADYEILVAHSAEAAWIATEGNAFNHATDRVDNVEDVAAAQKALGRPVKPAIEVSASTRVRQTAFRAALVERLFASNGGLSRHTVPGSFFEFITREIDPATQKLDLAFDSGNATGIFGMTKT